MSKDQIIIDRNKKLQEMVPQSSQRSMSRISGTPEITENTDLFEESPSHHSIDDDIYMKENEVEAPEEITSPTPLVEAAMEYNEWNRSRYPANFGEPLSQS